MLLIDVDSRLPNLALMKLSRYFKNQGKTVVLKRVIALLPAAEVYAVPFYLETLVDLDRFRCTCYKAANWHEIGRTVGYSRHGGEKRRKEPARSVYVYPVRKDFRKFLCS